MRLIEVVPNKKVVWLAVKNNFNFKKDKSGWTDTTVEFQITEIIKGGPINLHQGLVP